MKMTFNDVCTELNELYNKKNADYGDSFTVLRNEFKQAIIIRLGDKYNRLKNLYKTAEINVVEESIDDTLKDMASYCIMELMARRNDDEKTLDIKSHK